MRRAVALVAVAIAFTGCGVRPTGPIDAGQAPTAEATALPESTLFFVKSGSLVPVTRLVSPFDPQAVFNSLVAGPTAAERSHGLSSGLTGVGAIEVVSGAEGKMGAKGEMIMLRLKSNTAASARGPFGFGSAMIIGQLTCTSRSLAAHPNAVELLPTDSTTTMVPPQLPTASCDKFVNPRPSPG